MIRSFDEHMKDYLESNQDDTFQALQHLYQLKILSDEDVQLIKATKFSEKALKIACERIHDKALFIASKVKSTSQIEQKVELLSQQLALNNALSFLCAVATKDSKSILNKILTLNYLR